MSQNTLQAGNTSALAKSPAPALDQDKPSINGTKETETKGGEATSEGITDKRDENGDAEDEAKLIEALRQLENMHSKLTNLRRSIPRMIQPINTASSYSSPESLFEEFSKRTLRASEDVVEFTTLYTENKWIFDRASASRAEDSSDIKRWKTSQPKPSYIVETDADKEPEEKDIKPVVSNDAVKERDIGDDVEMTDGDQYNDETENVKVVVDNFKSQHNDVEVQYDESKSTIQLKLPPPTSLTFTIECVTRKDEAKLRYIVTTPPAAHLHVSILRNITTRPKPSNLKYLLDMISQYSSIYTTKCEKCQHLTGGIKAELPVVRRLVKSVKMVKASESEAETKQKEHTIEEEKIKDDKLKSEDVEMEDVEKPSGEEKSLDDLKKKDKPGSEVDNEVEVVVERWIALHESCAD